MEQFLLPPHHLLMRVNLGTGKSGQIWGRQIWETNLGTDGTYPNLVRSLQHIALQTLLSFTDSLPRPGFQTAIINPGTANMNRLIWLVCGIALLVNPRTLPILVRRAGHLFCMCQTKRTVDRCGGVTTFAGALRPWL